MGITSFLAAANTTLGMLRILLLILPIIDKAAPNVMMVKPTGPNTVLATSAKGFLSKLERVSPNTPCEIS